MSSTSNPSSPHVRFLLSSIEAYNKMMHYTHNESRFAFLTDLFGINALLSHDMCFVLMRFLLEQTDRIQNIKTSSSSTFNYLLTGTVCTYLSTKAFLLFIYLFITSSSTSVLIGQNFMREGVRRRNFENYLDDHSTNAGPK